MKTSNKLSSIRKLKPVNHTSTRGKRTWEWHISDGRQISVYKRKAGEVFGGHFHTGTDPSKNPERFLIVAGTVQMICSRGQKKTTHLLDAKKCPIEFMIYPYTYHEVIAKTDCLYIEYRPTHFNPAHDDTYTKEQNTQ